MLFRSVYKGAETTQSGDNAVDFDKAAVSGQNQVFATINLKNVAPGTYEWVRVSVTYQNYDIKFNINGVPVVGDLKNQSGSVASFVGFNTYLTKIKPKTKELTLNTAKRQGFWAFETNLTAPYESYNQISSGDAPTGATTVVNPLAATSPIPAGSCVVTGKLLTSLVVTGKETQNVPAFRTHANPRRAHSHSRSRTSSTSSDCSRSRCSSCGTARCW